MDYEGEVYEWDVYSHDVVALVDENGFDVAHLVRLPRKDGSPGFRTDDEEWQTIVNRLVASHKEA